MVAELEVTFLRVILAVFVPVPGSCKRAEKEALRRSRSPRPFDEVCGACRGPCTFQSCVTVNEALLADMAFTQAHGSHNLIIFFECV